MKNRFQPIKIILSFCIKSNFEKLKILKNTGQSNRVLTLKTQSEASMKAARQARHTVCSVAYKKLIEASYWCLHQLIILYF